MKSNLNEAPPQTVTPTVAKPPENRDVRIDWLRGMAALSVVIFHLFASLTWAKNVTPEWLETIIRCGWVGVPVFFVLSGRCVGQAWLREQPAKQFFLRRLRRIYPPYIASLLVVAFAILLRKYISGYNDIAAIPFDFTSMLATLFMVTAPATTVPVTNWVYWTLTYELVFYSLLGALLFIRERRLRIHAWLVMNLLFAVLHLVGFGAKGTPGFFLDYWPVFALGANLAMLASVEKMARVSLLITAAHFVGLAILDRIETPQVVGIFTSGVLLIPESILHIKATNIFARVGVFSYSLYLVHVPIGIWLVVIPMTNPNGIFFEGPTSFAAPFVGFVASIIGALVFHRLAERRWMTPPVIITPRPAFV